MLEAGIDNDSFNRKVPPLPQPENQGYATPHAPND
jgi:hypothetical protein